MQPDYGAGTAAGAASRAPQAGRRRAELAGVYLGGSDDSSKRSCYSLGKADDFLFFTDLYRLSWEIILSHSRSCIHS